MAPDNKLTITKLDVARSQIETAIELFFEEKDPISVHTLTNAGYDVLMDFGKTESVKPVIKDDSFIRPENRGLYIRRVNQARNFFKHANWDSNKILTFSPQATLFLLWDACRMYQELNPSSDSYLIRAFVGWFFGHDQELLDVLNEGPYKEAIKELRRTGALNDKKSFLALCQDAHWQKRFMEWNQILQRAKAS